MRLIDADKLELNCIYTSTLEKADTVYQYSYSEQQIEKAPTVEAIPIGWLDVYCTDCSIDMRDNDANAIKKLLEDWRIENGKENN